LLRRDVPLDEVQEVITELTEAGLINDLKFAKAWIATRDRISPRGKPVLYLELQKKGIDKGIAQEAFRLREEERLLEEDMSEEAQIKYIVSRKLRQYSHLPPEIAKRRLAGVLTRRGFPIHLVMRILNA
jgi:regulatory protein